MTKDLEVGVKLTADGKSLVGESRSASEALRNLGETAKTANNESAAAAERFTANLKRQADTLGMTASQVRAYDAAQMELNQAQRASVEASNRAIAAHENQQVALDDLRTRAAAAGVALGTALVTGLKASITAAGQAEQSHLRLEAVLKATGHAAGLTKADLDQMAGGMKERLGIGDAALRDTMAVLLTFRNVSRDSFGEALETSANLAAVMQTDLQSAVTQLGKALENPDEGLTALKRSGVSFLETQKDMIKDLVETGRQAEAITLILQTMKEKGLDGVSESMNQGITKASRDASMAWGDLLETIGGTDTVKSGVDIVLGSWTGYLKDMRQVIESGDWLDRLAFFTIGLKTPDMIAKSNAPAAADDPKARALAEEGLARQKAAQEEEIKAIKRKEELEKAKKKAEEEAKKATEERRRAEKQALESAEKTIAALKMETDQIGLNAIQKKMLVAATEAAKAPNDELRKQIMAEAGAYAQLAMKQEQVAENKKIIKEQSEALAKLGNNQTSQLRQQLEDMRAQNALIGLTHEQVTAMAGAKERETAAVIRNAAIYAGDMHDAYIGYANDLEETGKLQQQLMQERQVQQYAQTWNQTWSSMEQTGKNAFTQFAAHGKSALGSIKESLKLSVIDLLYQVTARPWIIQLGASLQSSFIGAANAASTSGGIGNLLGMGSNALSIGNLLGRGASALGFTSFGAGASGAASAGVFGAGGLNYLGGAGTALGAGAEFGAMASLGSSLASGLAAAAGPAMIAFAATQGLKMLAGDKRLGGGFGNVMNKIGDIPILGDLIPVIPLINALFGRGPLKQKETSLTGSIGLEGFESGMLQARFQAKGGLFRSNKTDFARVDAVTGEVWTDNQKQLGTFAQGLSKASKEIFGAFNDTAKQTSETLKQVGKDLGLSNDALAGFSYQINLVSEKGKMLTEEQIGKEIENMTEAMARKLLPTVDDFSKRGETALQTVSRLGTEFNSLVDAASLILGKSSADAKAMISGTTFQGRTAFVDAAGGTDALGQKAAFYSQNFYSSEELLTKSQTRLGEQLQAVGLSTDLTKEQLRGLVESFGQVGGISEDLLQSLLNLAPALVAVRNAEEQQAAQIQQQRLGLETQLLQLQGNVVELRNRELAALDPANHELQQRIYLIEDERAAVQKSRDAAATAFGALQKAVGAEKDKITQQYNEALNNVNGHIDSVTQSIGKLKSLSDALKATASQIVPMSRDAAKRQIMDAISTGRAGGTLPEADSLREALSTLGRDAQGFAGSFEYAREQAKTAILVGDLGKLAGDQLTLDERSLAALEAQRTALTEGFERQIAGLDGMLTQGQAQIDALNGINAGVLTLAEAIGQFNAASVAAGGATIGTTRSGITYQQIRDFANTPGRTGMEIYNAADKNGVGFVDYAAATGKNITDLYAWADARGLPRFAKGGIHRGGLRIVGENGPELEMTGPASIASNKDLVELLSNKELVDLLKTLIGKIDDSNTYNKRVSDKLDMVTIMANGQVALRTGT